MGDLRLSQLECDIARKLDRMPELKRVQAVLFINHFLDLFSVTREKTEREQELFNEVKTIEEKKNAVVRSRG